MDERAALSMLETELEAAGDDAAVVGEQVITTDMLHERSDFPDGTSRYTAGWRAVGASLSDVAAMGAAATAAVAVYAAPEFDRTELTEFVEGARDVCELVGGAYVGGDLDNHVEFTVATTAIGRTDDPVLRSGAEPGDVVCVTGEFGRSAAGLELFRAGDRERGNELFQFTPRIAAGTALAPDATAMMDSSDGLARSLHQLAEASDCGFEIEFDAVPVADAVEEVADSDDERREAALFFGEDFELVFTVPEDAVETVAERSPVPITRIGRVTEQDLLIDGETLPDRGYTHG
ncbi:thiamine-phosphate kinase [Natranaeroarchaeum aerophilus]|uniref:Thiamine-monophosphate kinase n=1 Tax=Natranaeroarchaeum aerophilus TaxID=2917711 RepID=A0AAE3K3K2_9EURY|nr:thiamine-phosphate kinase [Natranaeroarchaeum aerophilus]MCL9812381.1 thiamine-phosphate kinase [Natranaeroarchaeum aerophilus]